MSEASPDGLRNRARLGWWLFVIGLVAVAAGIAYAFAGILVLGVFGYYATRPIHDRLTDVVDSDGIAAWLTVLLVLIPLLLVLGYAGFRLVQQAQQALGGPGFPYQGLFEELSRQQRETIRSLLENPSRFVTRPRRLFRALTAARSVTATIVAVQLVLALAITLTAFLLSNDDTLSRGFRELVGGRDTTAYAYATAVDADFESLCFGNFLFVLAMAAIATVAYWATNVFAPPGVSVPLVLVLGFLTGVASLIPLVVGKIVYLPVVAYLGLQAATTRGTSLVFVGVVFVAYFLVLDFLPQTFLQPYITGHQLSTVLMMFGYLLGPILFGWYGLFLLPMLFIVMVQAVRIVLPNLIHGETLSPEVELGNSIGTSPREARSDEVDDGEPSDGK